MAQRTITVDQYGEGWSLARGLANTPPVIWAVVVALLGVGTICLNFSGWI